MFLADIILMANDKIREFQVNQISIITWSLGKIARGLKNTTTMTSSSSSSSTVAVPTEFHDLVEKLGNQAEFSLYRFSPQNLSNFLLGLSYLQNDSCRKLYFTISVIIKRKLLSFKAQELSNVIWSMATLNFNDIINFLDTFVNHVKVRYHEFKPEEISAILWSLATMKYYDCEKLIERFILRLKDLRNEKRFISDQSFANLLWSFQQFHIKVNDSVIDALLDQWKITVHTNPSFYTPKMEFINLSKYKAQHVFNILFAFADFGYNSKNVNLYISASIEFFRNRWHLFNGQDIGNYLWSLMVFEGQWLDEAMLLEGIDKYKEYGFHKMSLRDIRQMYQCIIHIRIMNPNVDLSECLPRNIEEHWQKIWSDRQKTSPLPLWLTDVLWTYESMGYPCRHRFLVYDLVNTSTIEISKKTKVAIEGISYLRRFQNLPGQPIMRFLWKLKILEKLGYQVILIDQVEWETLKGDDRKEYLKSKLDEIILN